MSSFGAIIRRRNVRMLRSLRSSTLLASHDLYVTLNWNFFSKEEITITLFVPQVRSSSGADDAWLNNDFVTTVTLHETSLLSFFLFRLV